MKNVIPEHTLQVGDCIIVSGKGLISEGIEWFTSSDWSHVAIYVGGGEGKIVEATKPLVRVSTITELLSHCDKVCVRRIPGLTVEQAEVMKSTAYSHVYKPYDIWQFSCLAVYNLLRKIGIKWRVLVSDIHSKMICSKLYAVCALTIPLEFHKDTDMVTPETLYKTSSMKTILEA